MNGNRLITFEGIEGSGKSTQIKRLHDYLDSEGVSVLKTREPGGTSFGKALRQILLDPDTHLKDLRTEILLFTADRLEHIQSVIQPALNEGKVVLCDRFIDSTVAYQHGGRALQRELVDYFIQMISLRPALTFLLDLDPDLGLKRAGRRSKFDRFEQEELAFHNRVRKGYLAQVKSDPDRFCVINVQSLSEKKAFEKIKSTVTTHLQNNS